MSAFLKTKIGNEQITDPLALSILISLSQHGAKKKQELRSKITVTEQDYQNFCQQNPLGSVCYPTLEDYRGYVLRPHLWD
jgi:hypothetical protein